MARSWILDIGGFAKKVKSTTLSLADQIKDCGAYRECPNCHYHIDNSDVSNEWPGFPIGIKFDPSDLELLEHLAAKCGVGNTKPHLFIQEFIPTLEGDQGICYTHPENLPGAKKDGSSVHFFHRTINAYTTGQRKRRKIQHHGSNEEHVRWHKTGKTKAVTEDGVHKGFKKIMVLYIRPEKGSKTGKSNWIMHQYHLGTEEDEKNGEYVVSKIFYKQVDKNEESPIAEEPDNITSRTSPRTPKPNPPNPPRAGKCVQNGDIDEATLFSFSKDAKSIPQESDAPVSEIQDRDTTGNHAWLAGESQAAGNCEYDDLDAKFIPQEPHAPVSEIQDQGTTGNLAWLAGKSQAAGNCEYDDLDAKFIPQEPHAPVPEIQDQGTTGNLAWLAGKSQAAGNSEYDDLDAKFIPQEPHAPVSEILHQGTTSNLAWSAGESQVAENSECDGLDDILLCKEILDPSTLLNDPGLDSLEDDIFYYGNRMSGTDNIASGVSVLDTLELDTPPDFDLSNLNFCSQDSIFDCLDGL